MRKSLLVVALAMFAVVGCKAPVPRDRFFLPEDSFMTTKRIESLVPPGMPIEKAREVMELHGFACTFEEALGIPHLQCTQLRRRKLWPLEGVWMATIYFEYDQVTFVQARYDENPYERGVCIPKRTARTARSIDEAKDAHAQAASADAPPADVSVVPFSTTIESSPAMPEEPIAAPPAVESLPPAENLPPGSVPMEIP